MGMAGHATRREGSQLSMTLVILRTMNLEDKAPKVPPTPSVRRTEREDEEKGDVDQGQFRSAVGGIMYLSNDVEVVAYAAKELAKGMSTPTVGQFKNLTKSLMRM